MTGNDEQPPGAVVLIPAPSVSVWFVAPVSRPVGSAFTSRETGATRNKARQQHIGPRVNAVWFRERYPPALNDVARGENSRQKT